LKSIVEIKLRKKIREEKSGSYVIKVKGFLSKNILNNSTINLSFSCDPTRVNALVNEVYTVIDQLKYEGVTEKELSTAKKILSLWVKRAMKQNAFWLSGMRESARTKIPLEQIFKLPEMLEELTNKDIKLFANTMFSENLLQQELHPKSFLKKDSTMH
jgi:zinc protease